MWCIAAKFRAVYRVEPGKGYNTLVPRELHKRERRKKLTQSRKTPRLKKVIGEAAGGAGIGDVSSLFFT
jgi:hypothetical protein